MIKDNVIKAYNFAEKAHRGQVRKFSGLDYFTHPKGVARIIEDLTNNEDMIVASLLHDVVEDTKYTLEDLEELFSKEAVDLVNELTSDDSKVKELSKKIYLATKMSSMSSDALTIKLADRLHNILYLQGDTVTLSFITKYYKETRFIVSYLKDDCLLSSTHDILIGKIDSILDFLQIRHKL